MRLFRSIRHKILEDDSTRKYIWYAIGEIFLVVLGILIAIQVSNWNEDRILRESATYHLSLLTNDLNEDKELLTEIISKFESNDESIRQLLDTFKGVEKVSDRLSEDIISLQLEYNFRSRNNALMVLVNTGEIGALDVSLQNKISQYYRSVDAIIERDLITNSYIQTKLEPHIFNEYNYLYGRGNTFPLLEEIYSNDNRPNIMLDSDQLLKDKKFEALLVARFYQNEKLIDLYNSSLASLNELLEDIQ